MTGLQAIGHHENDVKMPWYWIGTKKCLNDMEWLKQPEYTIQLCIEKSIRYTTKYKELCEFE